MKLTREEAIAKLAPHQEATDVLKAARFIEWLELLGVLKLEHSDKHSE